MINFHYRCIFCEKSKIFDLSTILVNKKVFYMKKRTKKMKIQLYDQITIS